MGQSRKGTKEREGKQERRKEKGEREKEKGERGKGVDDALPSLRSHFLRIADDED